MLNSILTYLPSAFPWKDSVQYFDTIDSTNTRAKALAARGAAHGTALIAGQQTGGRGRLGRSFHSPGGTGLYLSVILRPNCTAAQLMHLTCATAVAMCDAVEAATGLRPGIKWTNDLVCEGRKLGGILTELSLKPDGTVDYAVIGVGINCRQTLSDFPEELRGFAGSLAMATGKEISVARVAAAALTALEAMDRSLLCREAMMERYRADCITVGREISLCLADTVRHGKAVGIDDLGALLVQFPDGHQETVNAGEVSVRGMYGYI